MARGTFRVGTLGGASLEAPDGSALKDFAVQRKAFALVVLLARAGPAGVARDKIVSYLWPESSTDQARNALSNLLFRVRRTLGADAVVGTADLSLNASRVSSDVLEFEAAVAAGQLERAVSLHAGPFLDGFYVRNAPEFERWAAEERARLQTEYFQVLEQLAEQASARGDGGASAKWWRKRVETDPLSARVAHAYVQALIGAGERETALAFVATHAALVRLELGADPDPAITQLADRLRQSIEPEASAGVTSATTSASANPIGTTTREPTADRITHLGLEAAGAADDARNRTRRRLHWATLGGALAAAGTIVLVGTASLRRGHSASTESGAPDSTRVLVSGFTNYTGDSTLDYLGYVAADWITQGLSQSEFVSVVYGPTAFELSRAAAGSASGADSDPVRVTSSRSGAGTVIRGSYYLVRDTIMVSAEVVDARSAHVLRTIPAIAAPRSDPMRLLPVLRERTAGALATVLDARLASVSALSSPPPLVTAYRAYLEGLDLFRQGQPDQLSVDRFLLAARLDTSFMLPVIWAVMRSREKTQADSLLRVLERHHEMLAPVDRYAVDFLEASRDPQSTLQQKIETGSRISALAPGSNWSFMYAADLYAAGESRHALALLERIDPERGWAGVYHDYWVIMFNVQHSLGEYEEELRTAERAKIFGNRMGHPELGRVPTIRALIGLGLADSAMVLVRAALPSMSERDRINLFAVTARALRSAGRRVQADSMFDVLLDWHRARLSDRGIRLSYLDYELQAGQLRDAQAMAVALLADSSYHAGLELAHAALGVVAAHRRDRAAALEQIRQISSAETENPGLQWNGAKLQAVVAGALHDRQLALQYLAEMELHGIAQADAKTITYSYYELNWLGRDRRLRLAYAGGTP